jgi:hypothetical protein
MKIEIDTSLIEVMKHRMKAAITPERTLGRRMVKKVFSGGEPRLIAAPQSRNRTRPARR